MGRKLIIVPECNDENDNPCCWAMTVCDNHYIWVSKYGDKEYIIEDSNGNNLAGNKVYKTLSGARREAESIAWRQDENGLYTD